MKFSLQSVSLAHGLVLFLFCITGVRALSQDFNSRGERWLSDEEDRAYRRIVQARDFSSIDHAFALREANLLFEIYSKAEWNKYGAPTTDPLLADVVPIASEEARKQLNLEVKELALKRLRQLPGLARSIGDHIESTATDAEKDQYRRWYIKQLAILATDDSVVQCGRFLFDDRNPGVRDPAHLEKYDSRDVKFYVSGALISVLRQMPGIAADIKATPKGDPGNFEKAQTWWLKSPEAAPYRRKLADLGVKLPPGYPPLPELQKATSVASGHKVSAERPESFGTPEKAQDESMQSVWLMVCGGLVVLALLLTVYRGKQPSIRD